ncbi:MAG TPA: PIN domain-containing protein [Gemmatimonadales bacterium]|nr:PIN domain-containing protein [Gemmatimonadales bacterium]
MIVIADTGAIYALLDRDDAWHKRVHDWWTTTAARILLPHTIIPEVAWLVGQRLGPDAESAFAQALAEGEFLLEPMVEEDFVVVAALVHRYRDLSLGFVDASVLAIAARSGADTILTTDRKHFSVARLPDGKAARLVP